MNATTWSRIPSPLGDILLLAEGAALAGVYFLGQK